MMDLTAVKNNMGDNLLTLSGEILITPKQGRDKAALHGFDRIPLKDVIRKIQSKYSFLDVKTVDGLMDISIKMFANQVRVADKDFLDNFNNDLLELMTAVSDKPELNVRLNIFGSFETLEKKISYRYLNKKDDVRYAILDEVEQTPEKKFLRPAIYVPIIAILALCYLGYIGYNRYLKKEPEPAAPPAITQEKQTGNESAEKPADEKTEEKPAEEQKPAEKTAAPKDNMPKDKIPEETIL